MLFMRSQQGGCCYWERAVGMHPWVRHGPEAYLHLWPPMRVVGVTIVWGLSAVGTRASECSPGCPCGASHRPPPCPALLTRPAGPS